MSRNRHTLFAASALAAFLLYNLRSNAADYDLWGYMAFGRLFWQTLSFPFRDTFAYVPTKELWVYHEWLTGVLYFPIYKMLGEEALQLLKYAVGLTTAGLIYSASRKRGAGSTASLFGVFVSFSYVCSSGYAPVRAQIFTYLFFALSLYILETARCEQRWKVLWWLVPLQALWCNLHAGFLAGLGIIGLYTVGEALSRKEFWPYVKTFLAACFATLLNPYGVKYWTYLYESLAMPRPEITEWAPAISILEIEGLANAAIVFFALSFVAFLFIVWYRKYSLTVLIVMIVTVYLSFRHIRHAALFMVAFGVYMPDAFSELFSKFKDHPLVLSIQSYTKQWGLPLTSLVVTAYFIYSFLWSAPLNLKLKSSQEMEGRGAYYPLSVFEYMERHGVTGNILPLFRWGEYLMWAFYPRCHVGMDARYEMVYPYDYCVAYFDFMSGRKNWRDFLRAYPHQRILVAANTRIDALLQKEPGWVEEYRGLTGVLFMKANQSRDVPNLHGQ